MRYKYPNVGSNRGLLFEDRFTDPLHVAHNGGTVNLVGAATLPLNHGATFPTIASGLTAYITYPNTVARISACSAMTVVFDATFLAFDGVASVRMFQKYDNANNEWCVAALANGVLRGQFKKNGTSYPFSMTAAMPTGARTQYALTWSGAAVLVYMNGASQAFTASAAAVQETGGSLYIGGVTSPLRSCTLHHTRIWNVAKSQADIQALYAGRDVLL